MWGSMHSDFRGAAKKLEKETRERAQRAKQKGARESAAEERVKARLAAYEEEQRQRRLADMYEQEQERMRHEEVLESNNGVWWSTMLRAAPLTSDLASRIKRSADKVSLPPSAERQLTNQDASKNGAMLFELSSGGNRTHVGILDFTAAEGMIGMPPAVARNLWGEASAAAGQDVSVTYKKLQKGSFVRFQPRDADFQREVGDGIEGLLEQALLTRSTLTEGDWVRAQQGDRAWDLRVQQLRPDPQVSVIDTDMEADVDASLETEEKIAAELAAQREREAQLAAMAAAAAKQAQEQEEAARLEAARLKALRQAKQDALPPEPSPSSSQPVTTCLVRLPDGTRLQRRFESAAPLHTLFDFLEAQEGFSAPEGAYRLVGGYPRRMIESSNQGSFTEAGLGQGEHALMLEMLR